MNTPSADDPIYVAWAGTDKKPAVQGFNPGVGADLYTTNGEQTDWAAADEDSLAITPELSEGNDQNGFEFPDSEGEIQHEFNINKDFAVAAAKSATDPDNPVSPVNIKTQPFYTNFAKVGPAEVVQPDERLHVRALVQRRRPAGAGPGPARPRQRRGRGRRLAQLLHRRRPAGDRMCETEEWIGGDRYGGPGDTYYHIVGGHVLDAPQGSNVKVWFTGAGKTSDSFTFHVDQASADDVLILADTDYTGTSNFPAYPAGTTGPPSLDVYEDAVDNAGYSYDTYDVDALGAPDHLGVLSHYDAVIWYTADDLLSRIAGQPGGTGAETQANTMMLQVRAYLNEGGRLLYTGRHAGWQFANAFDYNPVSTPPLCDAVDLTANDGCLFLSDDFLQYWLGAYLFVEDGGATARRASSFDASGFDPPFGGAEHVSVGDRSILRSRPRRHQPVVRHHQQHPEGRHVPAVHELRHRRSGTPDWRRAYSPHTGNQYLYSQRADVRYQRLLNTLSPTPGDDHLSFFMSHDTELDWDFVFVEAHTPGQDDWVTLPALDENDEAITSNSTGESCPEGWAELHPFIVNTYEGADCSGANWNATSGRSPGWQQWNVDLSAWDNEQVEVSISYASDWSSQGLGVWVDDIDAPGLAADNGFEGGLGTWVVGDPTDVGSGVNALDWIPTGDVGFVEGAATSMDPSDADFRTLYLGFAFENVSDPAGRDDLMQRALDYLTAP